MSSASAVAPRPSHSSQEPGYVLSGVLVTRPHGPDLCVLGIGPLRSHRLVPSEFRSAHTSQMYATLFARFARKR